MSSNEPCLNTDRELYREPNPDPPGSYYADSIYVTKEGAIGMNCGGYVIVAPIRQWFAAMSAASRERELEARVSELERDVGQQREALKRLIDAVTGVRLHDCPIDTLRAPHIHAVNVMWPPVAARAGEE